MNNDPWELLREARDRLSLHMETYFSQQKGTMFLTIGLVERIDAALAEHDNVGNEDVVWNKVRKDSSWQCADLGNAYLEIFNTVDGTRWFWSARTDTKGESSTEDEAKAAAIAAVKGT